MTAQSPFRTASLLAASFLLVLSFNASAEEYGEDFYRSYSGGTEAPTNLKTPLDLLKTSQFQAVIVEAKPSARQILVRDSQNQTQWLTIPATTSLNDLQQLVSGERVWVKMAGITTIDISAI